MTAPRPPSPCVAVMTPTLRRPQSLARALDSLAAQTARGLIAQVVVVDNDATPSAREAVDEAARRTGLPIVYVHEPQPGVATARNRALAEIAADHVAFLDDDEEAPPDWLERLFAVHQALVADVTFGPVRGVAAGAPEAERPYLDWFFSRIGPGETGLTDRGWGCGNSLMRRATALRGEAPFDVAGNEAGGEDDRLFLKLQAAGARFAWAADAWVWEHAPETRADARYALRRAFAYGQGPTRHALRQGRRLAALRWIAVGAGQAAVFGAATVLAFLLRRPDRFFLADRTARGLGKMLWRTPTRFYGRAAA